MRLQYVEFAAAHGDVDAAGAALQHRRQGRQQERPEVLAEIVVEDRAMSATQLG
jgi:hypothetical protein